MLLALELKEKFYVTAPLLSTRKKHHSLIHTQSCPRPERLDGGGHRVRVINDSKDLLGTNAEHSPQIQHRLDIKPVTHKN